MADIIVHIDPGLEQALLTSDDPRQVQGRRGRRPVYPFHCCPVGGWWPLASSDQRTSCMSRARAYQHENPGQRFAFHEDEENEGGYICQRVS